MFKELKEVYEKNMNLFGINATLNNNIVTKIFFKEIKESNADNRDFKFIFLDYNKAKAGDVVTVKNDKYFLIEKEDNYNNVYNKFITTKAHKVIIKNKKIDAFIDQLKEENIRGESLRIVNNTKLLYIKKDIDININDFIIFNKKKYRVINIDDTREDINILKCDFEQSTQKIGYSIKTLKNEIFIDLDKDKTFNIRDIIITTKDEVEEDLKLKYTYNKEIIDIKNDIIIAKKRGTDKIKISLEEKDDTFTYVVVNINKKELNNMFIDNEDKNGDVIYYGDEEEYLIHNNNDNLKFTWSIDNGELAKIMKQSDNKCLIKANDCRKYGEIILTAKNENITLKKKIRIKDFLFG